MISVQGRIGGLDFFFSFFLFVLASGGIRLHEHIGGKHLRLQTSLGGIGDG